MEYDEDLGDVSDHVVAQVMGEHKKVYPTTTVGYSGPRRRNESKEDGPRKYIWTEEQRKEHRDMMHRAEDEGYGNAHAHARQSEEYEAP